jgi:hypothetical protein
MALPGDNAGVRLQRGFAILTPDAQVCLHNTGLQMKNLIHNGIHFFIKTNYPL